MDRLGKELPHIDSSRTGARSGFVSLTSGRATAKLQRMGADSGPDELRHTLAQVAERIERYRGKRIGEQDTKAALVVPVLRALGWNTEDLDDVKLEYKLRRTHNPVDYALLLQREPVLFIEAKSLDGNLDERRLAEQLVTYAVQAGVSWVVLTNGDEYRIYNALAPVEFDRKLFKAVRVTESVVEAADALRLLTKGELQSQSLAELWHAQTVNDRVRQSIEALFEPQPAPWLVRRVANANEGLTQGDVKAALMRARIVLDFPAGAPPAKVRKPPEQRPPARRRRQTRQGRKAARSYDVTVANLLDAGLIRAGAQLRKRYLGQDLLATVEPDGRVRFGNEVYKSLSIAAAAARVAVKGPPEDGRKYYQTNGWTFWEYEGEDGKANPMETLRARYLRQRLETQP